MNPTTRLLLIVCLSAASLAGAAGAGDWPHPVIAHGMLWIRDQDVLLCYDGGGFGSSG